MKIIKTLILILIIMFECYGQKSKLNTLKTEFYINNVPQENVKYYFLNKNEAYLLKSKNKQITLNDNLPDEFNLLAICKKHIVVIPIVRFKEVEYIRIYYDNRLFNNTTRKKFNEPFFKYMFKKNYHIDLGLDDIIITFKPKKEIKIIDN